VLIQLFFTLTRAFFFFFRCLQQGDSSCESAAVLLVDSMLIDVAISGERNVIKKGLDKIL
jgi:hypothetical protein